MTDTTFPVKKILLAAAAAPISYGMTLLRKTVPGVIALVVGYACLPTMWYLSNSDIQFKRLLVSAIFLVCVVCLIYGFTLLAVSFHRIFLLGAQTIPGNGLRSWTSRETRFFGWGIGIGVLTVILMIPVLFVFSMLFAGGASGMIGGPGTMVWTMVGSYAFLLPIIYVVSRWSLIFPATATDSRPSLGWAWDFSSNYQWQIAFTVGFATISIEMLIGLLVSVAPIWLGTIINIVLGIYLTIFGIAVLSFSYGFLKEAQPGMLPPDAEEN